MESCGWKITNNELQKNSKTELSTSPIGLILERETDLGTAEHKQSQMRQ